MKEVDGNSLREVLEQIKQVKPFAEEDVTAGPWETLRARRGRQAQAVEQLALLRTKYEDNMRKTSAFILVVGDKKDEFASTAVEHYKCFANDPNSFFADLAANVPSSLYMGKEGLSNIFDILGRHLEDKMLGLNVVGYPQLIFRQEYSRAINSPEDFTAVVRTAITEQIGGEIVGVQAIRNLAGAAIEKDHASKFTPILLPTSDERFALTVARDLEKLTPRVFIVAAGKVTKTNFKSYPDTIYVKEVSNENVEQALKTISNTLKK